jgi:two-component system phosphate regulon sensor histidine kinase PhoR
MNHDFILSANYLWETNSLIFLLSDVTPFRQLEQVKRDIVANASHELRTPLVSIKGYTELLAERITGEDKKIVQILERNINRLSSLVNDILVLSHLEKTADLDLGLTNVSQILDNVCLLYKLRLKEKSLVLHKNYEPGIIAQIDAFRFEQLVNNLLDNAIKYTLEGSITLSLSRCENELVFECCDTGVGIPENLIPRVFERFYTVDKSRSRKLGGTGLGLSIVKHIVNLHQGKISLNSDFGKGSCFKVTLPATR